MAGRTRSATRLAAAVATGPLGALSHDELGVIFDGLADPLQPVVAVALSSTCKGLRTPLRAALKALKEQHTKVKALCWKFPDPLWRPMTCTQLRDAERLEWDSKDISVDDMATLGMLLSRWLPSLQELEIGGNYFGDAGVLALCECLGPGAAPSLFILGLVDNHIGPVGAQALSAALLRGAMPNLEALGLGANAIGDRGVIALAAPLRKLPAIRNLYLYDCKIGDEGVASLTDNLGKDDFKELMHLYLGKGNPGISDAGCAKLVTALDRGAMPALLELPEEALQHLPPGGDELMDRVDAALRRRRDSGGGVS